MSVCETISTLATELEGQLHDLSDTHKSMICVMKKMPDYFRNGNLAAWEKEYSSSIADDEDEKSKNYQAIDLVYEIAAVNLYGAFEKKETKRIYKLAVNNLKAMGLTVSSGLNIEQW